MILSHRHRFVFIKGVKVASTSVEVALSQVCAPEDVVTAMYPRDERLRVGTPGEARNYSWSRWIERRYIRRVRDTPLERYGSVRPPKARYFPHMSLRRVIELDPRVADYALLYVCRSPYAKVLSQANWQPAVDAYRIGMALPQESAGLSAIVASKIADGSILFARDLDRYRDAAGRLRGRPWRFETLAEDLAAFFRSRGLPEVALPHTRRGIGSESLDPRAVLTRDQIAYINHAFADEFEAFGYPMLD